MTYIHIYNHLTNQQINDIHDCAFYGKTFSSPRHI